MFDPLSSTSAIFADAQGDTAPPWPTTPHEPNSTIPNLRRPSPPSVTTHTVASDGPFGKEPKIYGAPEPGLISPQTNVGSNGANFEKREPYLRVRITGLDRNRRDVLFRFDAQTNLSNFTGSTYRNVSRSFTEFQQFYDALLNNCPHTIIPALPLAQTSAPTDEEDDRLVRIMLQRWLTRICEDPIVMHDEDLRSFIESDFGYQPMPRPKRKMGSGFGLLRRGVPDEDEDLQRARFELTKLETQFFEAAKAIDKLSLARRSLSTAHAEMGNKLINVASSEAHPPLANTLRKLGRVWHSLADLDQAQSISECVVVGDTFGYQGMNARSAKEALLQRAGVLEEYQAAVKATISKRRNIERLKASSSIRPERVDEALEELEEANKYEQVLAQRADGISQNLHRALATHTKTVTDDVTAALIEHARSAIQYEKQLFRELEALRGDVSSANRKVTLPKANGYPKPSIILPLEDDPKSTTRVMTPASPIPRTSSGSPASTAPVTKTMFRPHSALPQSSNAVSSTAQCLAPPLFPPNSAPAGRLGDGTQSMSVKSTPSPFGPASASSSSSSLPYGPLGNTTTQTSMPASPSTSHPLSGADIFIVPPVASSTQHQVLDPLTHIAPVNISQSMRVQPSRPRLDARVAASKLANMF